MTTTTALKEILVDPVCGMTVDPARAAGVSERDGARYYFCSTGCKTKFDASSPVTEVQGQASCCAPVAATDRLPQQGSCCGGSAATAPVQLTASRQPGDADGAHAHHTAVAAHMHHETAAIRERGPWWHHAIEIIGAIYNLIGNRRGGLRPAKFRGEQ